ncbi:Kinesin light chain [Colletotrichum siamense]|uniref:Kinesin light chain n=1 Tax=Colletotrichum siamense TaxID=690259 RepID=A0A9P5F2D4_COLSI|nr:Kinesin light chain [Colletotrichum siamense]KAF4866093.1 Kinesin light chain [Colletotrichum siamense]
MAPKCIPASDFTIGWVCALPIELAAASGMMDEEYAQLPSQTTDSNVYSYGRIGVHNIVVACLPSGQMGTNSAATVASQMKSSFPSLRFGLLVGIGGGVPNVEENVDIRLGDVVVSQPSGQYGGVIQYDFGKTGADGRIARIGSLNAPPTILLNALSQLRANDILDKTRVDIYLSELVSSKPKFASPGPETDVLYEAEAKHIGGATCRKCRPEDEVDREKRMRTDPMIFFGNIASGNQVMKDGQTRDNHSRDLGGILCFEMEAAGLMNNFPCLVIRGICDYADAHKNKQWQPYAAATAAALAKELLCTIPSTVSRAENIAENPLHRPHFIVPFGKNKHFVGREDILAKLLERIPPSADSDGCQRTAIVGLGGIGKTQVAIEAAYRVHYAHPDSSVFWVPAVSAAMFDNHYRKIGQALKIEGIDKSSADVRTLVKDTLERDDINSWLLIIDNADDIDLLFTRSGLASYIPKSRRGSILLTTRNGIAAARYDRTVALHLSKMDAKEGIKLLHSGLDECQIKEGQSTTKLLEKLAHLPLAIRQASAYLRANQATSVSQYLKYCETSDEEQIALLSEDFDDQDRYEIVQNPIATTWLISFQNIARDKPLAAKYLKFICYLAEKDIPMALLPPGDSVRETNEAISTLLAYAFIQKRSFEESFDVHRLVRLVMQTWLRENDEEKQQTTETINRLSVVFTLPGQVYRNQVYRHTEQVYKEEVYTETVHSEKVWLKIVRRKGVRGSGGGGGILYMPHVQAALKMSKLSNNEKSLWILLRKASEGNRRLGNFVEAELYLREAVELKQKVLKPEDPGILDSLSDLACILEHIAMASHNDKEKHQEAEKIFRGVLESSKKGIVPKNFNAIEALRDLANTLRGQCQYVKAEKTYRQLLELQTKFNGPENFTAVEALANLANVLTKQEKYGETDRIHQQARHLSEKALKPGNPLACRILSDIGYSLENQGKLIQAERTFQEVLELEMKFRRPGAYFTLLSMISLSNTLEKQDKYKEAEALKQHVSEVKEKVLRIPKPDTPDSLRHSAFSFLREGKYEKAENLYQEMQEMKERFQALKDHDTLRFVRDIAFSLLEQGSYAEAETLYQLLLRVKKAMLGSENAGNFQTMRELAISFLGQKKNNEAEWLFEQLCEQIPRKSLRLKIWYPDYLLALKDLAFTLRQQRKFEQARNIEGLIGRHRSHAPSR